MLCTSADDFLRAAETGKIGFLLSFEGAEPVSSCLLLHGFYAAGVRGLGLAWSRRNAAADGCDFSGSLKKGGLTEFGRELVKEAEDLHMILDLSHLSDEGVEDVLSITSCPVIASHSNSRAVAGSNRNLTDCQMREIASRGGTVGLNGCSLLTAGPGVSPDQNGLTAHLDHMTEIMGEDHVAFGFDFCDSFFADDLSSSTDQMPERPFDILSSCLLYTSFHACQSLFHLKALFSQQLAKDLHGLMLCKSSLCTSPDLVAGLQDLRRFFVNFLPYCLFSHSPVTFP